MTLVAVPRSMAEPDWLPDPELKGVGLRAIAEVRAVLEEARLEHPSGYRAGPPRSAACGHPRVWMVDGVPWCADCGTVIDRVVLPCDQDPEDLGPDLTSHH